MKVIKSVLALVAIALTGCASQKTITTESLVGKWSIKSAMGTSTEKGESPAYITFEKDGQVNGCATETSSMAVIPWIKTRSHFRRWA